MLIGLSVVHHSRQSPLQHKQHKGCSSGEAEFRLGVCSLLFLNHGRGKGRKAGQHNAASWISPSSLSVFLLLSYIIIHSIIIIIHCYFREHTWLQQAQREGSMYTLFSFLLLVLSLLIIVISLLQVLDAAEWACACVRACLLAYLLGGITDREYESLFHKKKKQKVWKGRVWL